MKIVFLRSAERISGAERYNEILLPELKKNKELHLTFISNLKELTERIKKNGIHIVYAPWMPVEIGTKKQLLAALLISPIFICRYLFLFTKLHPDVLCLQSRTEKIFLTPIFKLSGIKIVWIEHGPLYVSEAAGLVKMLYRITSIFADKIIAVSRDTKQDLIRGGIFNKKIEVIYIGVREKPMRNVGSVFTVGFLGTLTKEKGINDFISATKGFHTLVIGDGPDGQSVKSTGFVHNTDAYLKQIDILLLPTRHHEGISMAILEALAMGIPVLATDIGGNKEIIAHRYNGYVFPLGDVKGMRKYILQLSKNKEKVLKMGRNARITIKNSFNITTQSKRFVKFFTTL